MQQQWSDAMPEKITLFSKEGFVLMRYFFTAWINVTCNVFFIIKWVYEIYIPTGFFNILGSSSIRPSSVQINIAISSEYVCVFVGGG